MKYIKCELFNNMDVVIMFPNQINHSDMAAKLDASVRSAGFVSLDNQGRISAYGRSESLDIDSDPDDAIEIECQLQPMIGV